MAIDALSAAKAYAQAAESARSIMGGGAGGVPGAEESKGLGFTDILQQTLGAAVENGRQADKAMAAATVGKGELVDVVTAIAAAEMSMETLVSVRDQAISAYQEVMRMPI